MFDFLIYDISVYSGYLAWKNLIEGVNQEYRQSYYYNIYGWRNAIICLKCHTPHFNYRTLPNIGYYTNGIRYVEPSYAWCINKYIHNKGIDHSILVAKLPKKY